MTCNLTEIELKYLVTKVTNKSDLAAKVGTSISTVDKYLKKYGISTAHFVKRDKGKPKNAANKKLKPADIEKVKQLIKEGVTQKAIAKMFKVCQCTISHIKKNAKCYYRHNNDVSKFKKTDERNKKIAKLYQEGLDQYQLGEMFKVNQAVICRILQSQGIKGRPSKAIPQSKIDQILELRAQGMNFTKIAKAVGVNDMTAAKYCRKYAKTIEASNVSQG